MASSRLYGKPLKKIGDLTLIERVYNNCLKSKYQSIVIIATDSKKIFNFCKYKNMNCVMTKNHNCGSSRIAEVAEKLNHKWIVEVQGDEPFLNNKLIDSWLTKCELMINKKYFPDLFLAYAQIEYSKANNLKYVKLVMNSNNEIIWSSRSKIPSDFKNEKKSNMIRHTGLHLWNRKSLIKFKSFKKSKIEASEDTHSLRMIENNLLIKGIKIGDTQAIDIPNDLIVARRMIRDGYK